MPARVLSMQVPWTKKPSAAQLRGLVDHLAHYLPTWKAAALPKSGRLILVLSVLCSVPIHTMLALDLPMKTIADMNKILRGLLWCGKAEANGGNCFVACDDVCMPKWARGLAIPCLRWLNLAMQTRWAWLRRVDRERPWQEFTIAIPTESLALFGAATRATVGNGKDILFQDDRWMDGTRLQELAPVLYACISQRAKARRTVHDVVTHGTWVEDVSPNMSFATLLDYMAVWQRSS